MDFALLKRCPFPVQTCLVLFILLLLLAQERKSVYLEVIAYLALPASLDITLSMVPTVLEQLVACSSSRSHVDFYQRSKPPRS